MPMVLHRACLQTFPAGSFLLRAAALAVALAGHLHSLGWQKSSSACTSLALIQLHLLYHFVHSLFSMNCGFLNAGVS
jgi:hypothetical protein